MTSSSIQFFSYYFSLNAEWPGNSISILPGAIIHICVLSESVVQWRCKLSKLVIWSCDQQQASGQEGQPRTKDWVAMRRDLCASHMFKTLQSGWLHWPSSTICTSAGMIDRDSMTECKFWQHLSDFVAGSKRHWIRGCIRSSIGWIGRGETRWNN